MHKEKLRTDEPRPHRLVVLAHAPYRLDGEDGALELADGQVARPLLLRLHGRRVAYRRQAAGDAHG